MPRGKISTSSAPPISFRFHPKEDDLEEVLDEGTGDGLKVVSEPIAVAVSGVKEAPNDDGHSNSTSPNSSKDPSPQKERLGRRSSSLESTSRNEGEGWSIFNELKGKIAKTVEEKLHIDLHSNKLGKNSGREQSFENAKAELLKTECKEVTTSKSCSLPDITQLASSLPSSSPTGSINSIEDCVIRETTPDESVIRHRKSMPAKIPESASLSELTTTINTNKSQILVEEIISDNNRKQLRNTKLDLPISVETSPSESVTTDDTQTKSDLPAFHTNLRWYDVLVSKSVKYSVVLVVIVAAIVTLPDYLSGLMLGVLLTLLIQQFVSSIFGPKNRQHSVQNILMLRKPTFPVPLSGPKKPASNIHEVWMNELPFTYNPETYHISNTQPVFVHLEGATMTLSYTLQRIPRRAMWDEQLGEPKFLNSRMYQLKGSKISLLPNGLNKKRLWSKKYPICLSIPAANSPLQHYCLKDSPNLPTTDWVSVEEVGMEAREEILVYLFTRSCRDKEEWFRLLEGAACDTPDVTPAEPERSSLAVTFNDSPRKGGDAKVEISQPVKKADYSVDYVSYMEHLMSLGCKEGESQTGKESTEDPAGVESIAWLNALLGRSFWDFVRDKKWSQWLAEELIQKKLAAIKVPYFMETLNITDLELGSEVPLVHDVSAPVVDERGLWLDFHISYAGNFKMTLNTKLNLMKLKQTTSCPTSPSTPDGNILTTKPSMYDSELEDSAESSDDDDSPPGELSPERAKPELGGATAAQPPPGGSKKMLRILNRIAKSSFFQQATDNKFIKKAMQDISNKRLELTVEVQGLVGTLAVNIPPPPTDRIWYGFRGNPRLMLLATPKVGAREVNVSHVTEWIEKKLELEFQKVLVMPNMDDFPIPIMESGINIVKPSVSSTIVATNQATSQATSQPT